MRWLLRAVPGSCLAVFGFGVLVWFAQDGIHSILLIPTTVGLLGLVAAMVPDRRFGQAGLVMGYLLGGTVAGFLVFGILTGPIGGDPEAIAAFNRVATPMLILYALSILSGVVAVAWSRLVPAPT